MKSESLAVIRHFGKLGRVEAPETLLESEAAEPTEAPYVPTPDNPPWGSWIALVVWGISVLLVLFVPVIFVTPYMITQGIGTDDRERLQTFLLTDETAVILQLAPVILIHAVTLLIAWAVVTKFNTYSFRQTLGWKMNGFRGWYAFALTIMFYVIAFSMTLVFGDVENDFERMLSSTKYAVYFVAFFATFTAPIVEEVIYRGLLYSAFQRRFGVVLAVLFTSTLFTLVHVPQYSLSAAPDHATIATLFLLSLTLTVLRAKTGNLLPSIVLHTVFNAIQAAVLIAYPFLKSADPVVEPTASLLLK